MTAAVYLSPAKEISALKGHPWIFPKAIARTQGKPENGELVSVYGSDAKFLGKGVFNEHSLYRIRMLAYSWEIAEGESSLTNILDLKIKQARLLRQSINLPNEQTSAYRLINSEADGLSGLTVDIFNSFCVVSSSAFWVEKHRTLISTALREVIQPQELIWISQVKHLAQDGCKEVINQPTELKTTIREETVLFSIDFSQPQKTGLFLDQRENHQRIAALAKGKKILDLYTYTGGFALHAAKAGASMVTAVDSSTAAIDQAKTNAELNQLTNIEFIAGDARDYLEKAGNYDIIILDPPKLVPSKQDLNRAKNYYRFLHRELFKVMRPGSLLMTCNCSSALTSQDFSQLVTMQARMMQKNLRILGIYGPAKCHPVLAAFPEGHYLSAILLAIV